MRSRWRSVIGYTDVLHSFLQSQLNGRSWPVKHHAGNLYDVECLWHRAGTETMSNLLGTRALFGHDLVVVVVELVHFLLPGPVSHLQ